MMSVVWRVTMVEFEFWLFGDGGVDTLPDVADALLCHSRTYPCTVPTRAGARKPMTIDDGFLRGILWLGSGRVARRLIIPCCMYRKTELS